MLFNSDITEVENMLKSKKISILLGAILINMSLNIYTSAMEDSLIKDNLRNYDLLSDKNNLSTNGVKENEELKENLNISNDFDNYEYNFYNGSKGDRDDFYEEYSNNNSNNNIDTNANVIKNNGRESIPDGDINSENEELRNFLDDYNGDENKSNDNNGLIEELDGIILEEPGYESGTVNTENIKTKILGLINNTDSISDEFSQEFKNLIKGILNEEEYKVSCILLDFIPKQFFGYLKNYAEDENTFFSCFKKLINKKSGDIDLKEKEYPKYFKKLNDVMLENIKILTKINLDFNNELKNFEKNNKYKEISNKTELYDYLKNKFVIYKNNTLIYRNFVDKFNSILKNKFHFPKYENNYSKVKSGKGYTFNIYPEKFDKEYTTFLEIIDKFQNNMNSFYEDLKTKIEKFIKKEKNEMIEFFKELQNHFNPPDEKKEEKNIEKPDKSYGLKEYRKIENISDIIYNLKNLEDNMIYYKKPEKENYNMDFNKKIKYFKGIKKLEDMIVKINNSKISFSADSSKLSASYGESCSRSSKSVESKKSNKNNINMKNIENLIFNFNKSRNSDIDISTNKNNNKSNKDSYWTKQNKYLKSVKPKSLGKYINKKNDNNLSLFYNKSNELSYNMSNNNYNNTYYDYAKAEEAKFDFDDYYNIGDTNKMNKKYIIYKTKELEKQRNEIYKKIYELKKAGKFEEAEEMEPKLDQIDKDIEYNNITCHSDNSNINCTMHKLREDNVIAINKYGMYRIMTENSDSDYKLIFENQDHPLLNRDCTYKIRIKENSPQINESDIEDINKIIELIDDIFFPKSDEKNNK